MSLAIAILVMRMWAQQGQIGPIICNYCGQLDDENGNIIAQSFTPTAEHVIEIRTKRWVDTECWDRVMREHGCDPAACGFPDVNHDMDKCNRVKKTLWLDGQRWGVLRETDESGSEK